MPGNTYFDMQEDFKQQFSNLLDNFMITWGDYVGDSAELDRLVAEALEDYVQASEFFE